MKKSVLKTLTLIVCAATLTTSLSACSTKKDPVVSKPTTTNSDPSALEWKSDTSPFTFKQFFYGTWATAYLTKDQVAFKNMTSKTGVTVDRFLATGNDADYLNTMIASDDLPDSLMLEWSNPIVTKLINSGMIYSMSELMDKYTPKFKSLLDPELVQYHSVNGKLWYLPNFYNTKQSVKDSTPQVSIRPWFVRKDIYAAIGSPKLDTPDSYIAAMKLAKQKYPDIYPVGMEYFNVNDNGFKGSRSMDYLISAYAPTLDKNRIKDDKQIVEYPMRDTGFKNAFKFVNTLSRDGLFDPQNLIMQSAQLDEILSGAKNFIVSRYIPDIYKKFNPKIDSTLGKDKDYIALDALKVDGKDPQYASSRSMGWLGLFITKKAKNPERIVKWAEYAWSDEGQLDNRYGKLGETYDMIDGLPQLKPAIIEEQKKDGDAYDAKYGFEDGTLLWRSGSLWDKAGTASFKINKPVEFATQTKLSKYSVDTFNLAVDNLDPDGSSPEGVTNAKIKDLWNKTIPKLVLAKSDTEFENIYSDFLTQMDRFGAEKVEKVMYQKHLVDAKKKGLTK